MAGRGREEEVSGVAGVNGCEDNAFQPFVSGESVIHSGSLTGTTTGASVGGGVGSLVRGNQVRESGGGLAWDD